MDEFKKTIPITTEEGNEYLIEFSKFNQTDIDTLIPIIDISLALTNEDHQINSIKTLFQISDIVKNYLSENNVILYFYCDTKDIKRSKKTKNYLHKSIDVSYFHPYSIKKAMTI